MIVFHIRKVKDDGTEYESSAIVLETFAKAEEMENFFAFYPHHTFRVTTLMDKDTYAKLRIEQWNRLFPEAEERLEGYMARSSNSIRGSLHDLPKTDFIPDTGLDSQRRSNQ